MFSKSFYFRSESPMSDRYCGKCSSLISLHLRTIESDGELMRTTSTQTRPQSKGKAKKQKLRPSGSAARKSSRNSLDKVEAVVEATSPSRRLKKGHLRSLQGPAMVSRSTGFESSSSNESLHSST